jgi:hypothetical protein
MLFIVYKSPDSKREQFSKCPLILELDAGLLNKEVSSLKVRVHGFFKDYLSPFISQDNIRLTNKKGLEMVNEFPLCMYLSPDNYFQEIFCTVKPSKLQESEQKWKYFRNSVIVMT